jgi:hypothetical protein
LCKGHAAPVWGLFRNLENDIVTTVRIGRVETNT